MNEERTTTDSAQIKKAWKRFRNRISNSEKHESLYVVWAYFMKTYYSKDLPPDIEHNQPLSEAGTAWLALFRFPIFIREIVSEGGLYSKKTLRAANNLNQVYCAWFELDGVVARYAPDNFPYQESGPVKREILRLSHQQFPWQNLLRNSLLVCDVYYYLFSVDEINSTVRKATGLSTLEIIKIGLLLCGEWFTNFFINEKIHVDAKDVFVDKESVNKFLSWCSIEIDNLAKAIKSKRTFDDALFYNGLDDVLEHPIIKITRNGQTGFICPMPLLLINRISAGVFIDCIRSGDAQFSNHFGERFQQLCGVVINHSIKQPGDNLKCVNDVRQTQDNIADTKGKNVDWIIFNDKAALFLECKTKKLTQSSIRPIFEESKLTQEIAIVADNLFQIYETIFRYEKNDFKDFLNFSNERAIYPVIVGLQENFLGMSIGLAHEKINALLSEKFISKKLPNHYCEKYPYSFLSVFDLKGMLTVFQEKGLLNVMKQKTSTKYCHYEFKAFVREEYGDDAVRNFAGDIGIESITDKIAHGHLATTVS